MLDDDGRAYLLCSECESPVYFVDDDNDGDKEAPKAEHTCRCDDPPTGYRIGTQEEIMARL